MSRRFPSDVHLINPGNTKEKVFKASLNAVPPNKWINRTRLQRTEPPPILRTPNGLFIRSKQMVRKKQYDFYDDDYKATAVALGALPGVEAIK